MITSGIHTLILQLYKLYHNKPLIVLTKKYWNRYNDFDNAVLKIIIGLKNNADEDHFKDDIVFLIKEIREKLQDSPGTIFPFIESCSRIASLRSSLLS